MHLASITSQEENDKLEKYIKDFGEFKRIFYTYVNTIFIRQQFISSLDVQFSLELLQFKKLKSNSRRTINMRCIHIYV